MKGLNIVQTQADKLIYVSCLLVSLHIGALCVQFYV